MRTVKKHSIKTMAGAWHYPQPRSAGLFHVRKLFIDNLNAVLGSNWNIGRVILPIGISFFLFTQIAYLVDTWRNRVREYRFIRYSLL